ncbi:hypothetical protein CTO_0173 [Chlamydia trachomatis A2497]|uniref:Uncharacterized protein n=1 Tax=Chlamydia trachomatis serovar A (strain A2497) TaxID=580047 RepID=G4NNY9_CHLT4|nr:hypothetical protein CTO_0173 [Chlamydia trachomatis A2497]
MKKSASRTLKKRKEIIENKNLVRNCLTFYYLLMQNVA